MGELCQAFEKLRRQQIDIVFVFSLKEVYVGESGIAQRRSLNFLQVPTEVFGFQNFTVRMDKAKEVLKLKKKPPKNPVKKWTTDEVKLLIQFLFDHPCVEKPTAKVYYTELLKLHPNLSSSWNLVRYKVKNMKTAFKSARDWANGQGAFFRVKDPTFYNDHIQSIFPFYDEFDKIFGDTIDGNMPKIVSVEGAIENKETEAEVQQNDVSVLSPSYAEEEIEIVDTKLELEADDQQTDDVPVVPSIATLSKESSSASSPMHLAKKVRKLYKASLTELYELQKERKEQIKEKLVLKDSWKRAEVGLEQQRLNFEKEKFWKELHLKKLEMQSKERIRQMEIKKEKYELELKYKCKHCNKCMQCNEQ